MHQNAPDSYHEPVLLDEVVDLFAPAAGGLIVDGTLGGAGHTVALLMAYPGLRVLGLDRDVDALDRIPHHDRLDGVHASFADLDGVLEERLEAGPDDPVLDGVLLDLGVSSHQLDTADRGFAYRSQGPIDMRMDRTTGTPAGDLVNELSADELTTIFRRYGEERYARRIAEAVVAQRPLADTTELAKVVANAVPAAARRDRHPARRVFQALRIAVNDELAALQHGLDRAVAHLVPGGRLVVISYHSLEDRIVKRRLSAGAAGCTCPPSLPVCGCGRAAELRLLARRAVRPSQAEVEANPRARSARLRAAEKVAA